MLFDEVIYGNLKKLDHLRSKPEWVDFFSKVDRLEKFGEEINEEMHNDPCDTSKLDREVQSIIKDLEDHKQEIANKTKSPSEYDAIHDLIDDLKNHFSYTD